METQFWHAFDVEVLFLNSGLLIITEFQWFFCFLGRDELYICTLQGFSLFDFDNSEISFTQQSQYSFHSIIITILWSKWKIAGYFQIKKKKSGAALKFMFSKKDTKKYKIFTVDLKLTKGQLISKCLLGVFNSPKKRTKTIRLEVP